MRSQVILADDFTGAHDVGLPFAMLGFDTVVISDPEHLVTVEADIIVVNTGSRDCSVEEAIKHVGDVCRAIQTQELNLLYKKIDSTLRGHIGREIDCIHESFDHHLTIVAPAFPALGRTTVGGYQLVNGVPVDQTSAGRDPGSPVSTAYLLDLIREQSVLPVAHVDLRTFT
jgi:uncharacterized protein YgbK (DUF1537 family)